MNLHWCRLGIRNFWMACVLGIAACSTSGAAEPEEATKGSAAGQSRKSAPEQDARVVRDSGYSIDSGFDLATPGSARSDAARPTLAPRDGAADENDVTRLDASPPSALDASSVADVGLLSADTSTPVVLVDASQQPDAVAHAAPQLSDLSIEPNPNNNLSAWVSWTTSEPATSEVRFGLESLDFEITSDELTTNHRVLVIGLYAETDYRIEATSRNAFGVASLGSQFRSGKLPGGVVVPTLTVHKPGMQSGWTLSNVLRVTKSTPAQIVMYDELGVPVWYHTIGTAADTRGDIAADLLENGNVLIGPTAVYPAREITLAGEVVWEGPAQSGPAMSHHVGKLSNGNYILLRDPSVNGVAGALIEEYTPQNEVVWSWSLFDHYTPPDNASGDWCHANDVNIDEVNDVLYLSCRFLGVFKARRHGDQAILWYMAAKDRNETGTLSFATASAQQSDQHEPDLLPDGTIMLYDNGGYAGGYSSALHSRVLQVAIDEQTQQVSKVWEFPGKFNVDSWYKQGWYTPIWGDADLLPNGNVLVTAGMRLAGYQTRIFEVVKQTGEVVWEIQLPERHGSYRAARLSPPPLVRRIASESELDAGLDATTPFSDAGAPPTATVPDAAVPPWGWGQ